MKRLFRSSQPSNNAKKSIVFTFSFFLFTTALLTATLAQAQSDKSVREQEDQLIRQFDLPTSSPKTPVYRPRPQQAPQQAAPVRRRRQVATPSQPRRQPAVVQEAPAPRPQRRQPVVVQEAPAPIRRSRPPVQQATPPARVRRSQPQRTPVQEASVANNLPKGQYVLEFNRSPVVGNNMRLRGVYSEGRLGFTRPRGWKINGAKALIRFQHSPALYANRSNLTLLVNGKSVGSVPLNRKQSQIGQALFNIPPQLIQDYNELAIVAQQNNSTSCSDPSDQTLWTEILPDSKLLFDFQPQPIPLNFNNYPYPFFDELSLDPNRIVYLLPNQVSEPWLTSTARFQAALGRLANFRPIETDVIEDVSQVEPNERLVIVGTPEEQPNLESLDLPFTIAGNQILDRSQNPLPADVGVLMLTTTEDGSSPVLVVTGNGQEGVAKAAQFLAQPETRKLGAGEAVLVDKLTQVPSPPPRQWPRFLPDKNSFKLSDIKTQTNNEPFTDTTVRGSNAPAIEFDFRALPDDRFVRGSSMNLVYSYGPQINPRTSAVEVLLNNGNGPVYIGGARLTSESGATRKNLRVNLPEKLITPNSKIQVFFRMNPREPFDRERCLQPPDQQLTGTVHAETSFDLKRETSVQLPDLKLLQAGFPFAAPQDLSNTAVVLPENPSDTAVLTLLAFSERLGRLSQADSVKLDVYTVDALPEEARRTHHLVAIGTRDKFPFPEVFNGKGLRLSEAFSRATPQGAVQTLPDNEGVIKQIMSPWNSDRVLLALSAQTETGLDRVRQILTKDPWFFQLQKDTVLISSDIEDPAAYDPDAYKLEFLQDASTTRRLENTTLLGKLSRLLQENWLLLPLGIVGVSLLLYGIVQLYIKRVAVHDKK